MTPIIHTDDRVLSADDATRIYQSLSPESLRAHIYDNFD